MCATPIPGLGGLHWMEKWSGFPLRNSRVVHSRGQMRTLQGTATGRCSAHWWSGGGMRRPCSSSRTVCARPQAYAHPGVYDRGTVFTLSPPRNLTLESCHRDLRSFQGSVAGEVSCANSPLCKFPFGKLSGVLVQPRKRGRSVISTTGKNWGLRVRF